MNGIERQVHRLGLAIQLLTRVPVPVSGSVADDDLIGSTVYYPLVGAMIGLALAAIGQVVYFIFPAELAALWIVVASIVLTGNFHVDGLMDTADGLYGAYEPARRLEIMRDSRVGAYGVVAAALVILMKLTLLKQFPVKDWWIILPVTMTCARWSLVYGARHFQYARLDHGLGKGLIGQLQPVHFYVSSGVALLIVFVSMFGRAPLILIIAWATWMFSFMLGRYIEKKIGGMTGDTLGAINEMVEVAVMTVILAMYHVQLS